MTPAWPPGALGGNLIGADVGRVLQTTPPHAERLALGSRIYLLQVGEQSFMTGPPNMPTGHSPRAAPWQAAKEGKIVHREDEPTDVEGAVDGEWLKWLENMCGKMALRTGFEWGRRLQPTAFKLVFYFRSAINLCR